MKMGMNMLGGSALLLLLVLVIRGWWAAGSGSTWSEPIPRTRTSREPIVRSTPEIRPESETIGDDVRSTLDELRRSVGRWPAAKGEIDELSTRLRRLLTTTNVADVAASLTSGDLAGHAGTVVLECWLAADRVAASIWIAELPHANDHHAWLTAEALTQEPALLEAFCRRLEPGEWTQAFLDQSSRILLARDPVAAATLARSLAPGVRREHLLETIASDWMLRDPHTARDWISSEHDPALRQRLVSVGAQSQASIDALGALEWLLENVSAESVMSEAIRTIAGIGSHTADPATAAWFEHLLAGNDFRSEPVQPGR